MPLAGLRDLEAPAGPGSGEPFLSASPQGRVRLSWIERRDSLTSALRVAALRSGRWDSPRTVVEGESLFVNWADCPSVIEIAPARLVAHYLWKSGAGRYAYDVRLVQSWDDGANWSPPVIPHRDRTATEHGFVSLVAEGDGVRAVWLDGRNFANVPEGEHGPGADMTVRTARITRRGALKEEAVIDERACECCPTGLATTSAGLLVAYRDRGPDERRDMSLARLEPGKRWTKPAPLHTDGWTVTGCPVNGPALDAAGARVAAAWFTEAGDTARVLVSFSADGGRTFSAPRRVDQGDPIGRADIALLDDGSAIVLWMEREADAASWLVRRVAEGGVESAAQSLARTEPGRAAGYPRVVRAGDRLIFAWTDPGTPSQVRVMEARLSSP